MKITRIFFESPPVWLRRFPRFLLKSANHADLAILGRGMGNWWVPSHNAIRCLISNRRYASRKSLNRPPTSVWKLIANPEFVDMVSHGMAVIKLSI
ncbi:hypothetical protein PC123_g22976 [Phytophthora cactorum]|nr:hypothetical protein PC123_g22976 [Phytophthora cactorum]